MAGAATVTFVPTTPVPVMETVMLVCAGSFVLMVSNALSGPPALGAKATVNEQFAPGFTLVQAAYVKSSGFAPEFNMLLMFSTPVPTLAIVTVAVFPFAKVVVLLPTGTVPKTSAVAEICAIGTAETVTGPTQFERTGPVTL